MKILSAPQLKELDKYSLAKNYLSELDLIENAAKAFVLWFNNKVSQFRNIKVFAGVGNNGADGLAIARILSESGFKVEVFIVQYSNQFSKGFLASKERLQELNLVGITELTDAISLPAIRQEDIVIDALWGYGLNKPITGFAKAIIEKINKSRALVVAVDIPSGLYADKLSDGPVIKADYTLSFELPKLAFLFSENEQYVGTWEVVPIGLDQEYLQKIASDIFFLKKDDIKKILLKHKRKKFGHKGNYGHVLTVGGSFGKMGAAVLMNKGALKAGAGLVTTHIPACGYEIMQTAIPEVMVETDLEKNWVSEIPDFRRFDVIAVGPGLGTHWRTEHAFRDILSNSSKDLVIDADGLNILAENPDYFKVLPKNSVLTPHPKEFVRLFGKSENSFERLKLLKNKAKELGIYIILKGAYTEIATPEGFCFFNSTGNPGMATAGTGDALTGIIAGLLAQGFTPLESALTGTYLHGLAGDLAVHELGENAMITSNVLTYLGKAFITSVN